MFTLQLVESFKAMASKAKAKEKKEIDRLLSELEQESLLDAVPRKEETAKAAGHKYIRKYRNKGKWTYVYANEGSRHDASAKVSASRVLGKQEHMVPGSSYSLGPGKGHAQITSASGDKITYKVDGQGDPVTVSKAAFEKKILDAHRPQVEAHAKKGLARRQDILARATKVDPNSKQTARAKKELARWKAEAKDFLPAEKKKKEAPAKTPKRTAKEVKQVIENDLQRKLLRQAKSSADIIRIGKKTMKKTGTTVRDGEKIDLFKVAVRQNGTRNSYKMYDVEYNHATDETTIKYDFQIASDKVPTHKDILAREYPGELDSSGKIPKEKLKPVPKKKAEKKQAKSKVDAFEEKLGNKHYFLRNSPDIETTIYRMENQIRGLKSE